MANYFLNRGKNSASEKGGGGGGGRARGEITVLRETSINYIRV